jgi:hypothetical protein
MPRVPSSKRETWIVLFVLARVFPAFCLCDLHHTREVMRLLVCRHRIQSGGDRDPSGR